ncbi:hypothetical protein COT48_01025 [Candidatus Woesearchaeota archaeon CG08_land_8_20_14_0_20_47_9]|nr:MAG: hypothetical protein COT48_01025 [Candidatus Woesearchaeota archaeon CG08_land_8_20_14_0_20_47_9]
MLANSNAASIGDPVLQPAPYDGGKMDEQIATLHSYVPITFGVSGTSCPYAHTAEDIMNLITKLIKPNYEWELKKLNDGVNYVDCALAKPLYPGLLNNLILEVGVIKGTAQAFIGMKVRKSGRTTGYTKGEVLVLDTTVTVDYGFGKAAVFENQIIAGAMSRGGDSGSLVLDENNNAVGLLFAGSDEVTILNPIEHVTSALGISLTL